VKGITLGAAALAAAGAAGFALTTRAPAQQDHEAALKNEDGSWKHTNRLIESTSPYLLQHAHNPVDWRPWDQKALDLAREQDKPIFLSVGYSTCYWCHVMEREVFSDPEIASLMNEHFINIKVDREQRPDIDEVYMTATQLMTQSGGWPNSVFLTPDLKPFFAGTYFGPEDRFGRPGFPRVLEELSDAWRNRRDEVLAVAERAGDAVRRVLAGGDSNQADPPPLDHTLPDAAVAALSQSYDERYGGFGMAPKFPQGFVFPLLFDVHERAGEPRHREMALRTLRMMAAGGIRDHVGGGFHRYSTDARWAVPHFEKMLYNQAQLARAYIEAHRLAGDPSFERAARDIFRFVDEVMTSPHGAFYSALDAETDAVEGAMYAWSRQQIERTLDPELRSTFDAVFDIAQIPHIPGHKHPGGGALVMKAPLRELAESQDVEWSELRRRADETLAALREARAQRPLPRLDDKVIAGWNGLMIDAYAFAGESLETPEYTTRARRAAAFILDRMLQDDGRLMRIWRKGEVEQEAFIEDYAFVIRGLLSLHRTTGEARWLDAARRLEATAANRFWDDERGGYYFSPPNDNLLARSNRVADGAVPAGNSVMAHNLITLASLDDDPDALDRAQRLMRRFAPRALRAPQSGMHLIHAVERFASGAGSHRDDAPAEVSIGFPAPNDDADANRASLDSARRVTIEAIPPAAPAATGERFEVRLRLRIDEGWHINAHEGLPQGLIPTSVDLRSERGLEVVEIRYPEPITLRAPFADRPIPVFEGEVEIVVTARFTDAPADGARETPLRALWRVQACDDARCLRPAEGVVPLAAPTLP